MTQFSGTFTITQKDNVRYNFFLMRKKLVATSAIVFVIIFAMIALLKYAQGAGITAAILNGAIMSIVGVAILVGINIATTIGRISRYYKLQKLTDFSVTFTTDNAGIHSVSERGDSDLPWDRIVAVHETRNAFYIFITESHANVMPKDQFTTPQDAALLRSLFEKNVPKPRLKLKA